MIVEIVKFAGINMMVEKMRRLETVSAEEVLVLSEHRELLDTGHNPRD